MTWYRYQWSTNIFTMFLPVYTRYCPYLNALSPSIYISTLNMFPCRKQPWTGTTCASRMIRKRTCPRKVHLLTRMTSHPRWISPSSNPVSLVSLFRVLFHQQHLKVRGQPLWKCRRAAALACPIVANPNVLVLACCGAWVAVRVDAFMLKSAWNSGFQCQWVRGFLTYDLSTIKAPRLFDLK